MITIGRSNQFRELPFDGLPYLRNKAFVKEEILYAIVAHARPEVQSTFAKASLTATSMPVMKLPG